MRTGAGRSMLTNNAGDTFLHRHPRMLEVTLDR
jgi:hypothetical protein